MYMKKVLLKCINDNGLEGVYEVGETYEFLHVFDYDVYVFESSDMNYQFTEELDDEGLSYKTWFKLIDMGEQ